MQLSHTILWIASAITVLANGMPVSYHGPQFNNVGLEIPHLEKRDPGSEIFSPIFSSHKPKEPEPIVLKTPVPVLDGPSTPAIPSAPWPYGSGTKPPAQPWNSPPRTKFGPLPPMPDFGPFAWERRNKPEYKPPVLTPLNPNIDWSTINEVWQGLRPTPGGLKPLPPLKPIPSDAPGIAELLERTDECPNCGRKPSKWERFVEWVKKAWKKVKDAFTSKTKDP